VVTAVLLVACTVAFGVELVVMTAGGEDALIAFVESWGLVPADIVAALGAGNLASQPVVTVFTHMFLHGGWLHLMGNMLFLWIFAVNVEDRLGRVLFLLFYLVGGVAAAAGHILVDPGSDAPMVGASGAISAVLGGYLVLFPRARIQSLVFLVFFYELIAVPAVIVLGFWFVLQLIDGFASLGLAGDASTGIAFWAHIGGFVAGMAMALPLRALRRARSAGDTPGGALAPAGGLVPAPAPVPAPAAGDAPPEGLAPAAVLAPATPPPPPGPPAPDLPPPPPPLPGR
jgi:membrane associated rhomboid family serine protease